MICAACNAPVEADDAFCRACGARQAPAGSRALSPAASAGERRQMTAMFYDMVGSTALSTQVDAEDLQIAMHAYQRRCADVVRNFGGTPQATMGDGGLVYFGYPIANEDDPLRAVSAGLALIAELPHLNRQIAELLPHFDHQFQMRIGVHTGNVVLGEVGSDLNEGRLATGEALNQAARIESAAPVDGVAVSDVTARRIQGVVDLRPLGQRDLKGIDHPVELFEVVRLRPGQSRFAVSTHAMSPLVGRGGLLQALEQHWHATAGGSGCTVVLRGDAGIGKSRAHHALRQQLTDTRHAWFQINGSSVMSQTAFHPIIQAIYEILEIAPGPDAAPVLAASLAAVGITDEATVELLAAFLDLVQPTDTSMSAEERRRLTIDAVCEWWLAIADTLPTVMVAEDLHWYDPSTLEVLNLVIQRAAGHPLLLIGTARPSFEISWPDEVTVIDVEPLSFEEVNQLVDRLAEGTELTELQRAHIAQRSDGVPLFAEELVHSLEGGNLAGAEIPDTLVDLLNARLDRLGPAKEVVQVASLIGREFSAALLGAVLPQIDGLDAILGQLVDGRFVDRRGVGARSVYLFRHALLQDAARESMLRRRRQAEHRRIAEVLRRDFGDMPEGRPEVIGHHLEHAGEVLGAVEQYLAAARSARRSAALEEAAGRYRHSITLIHTLPAGAERDGHEIALQLELAAVMGLMHAFSAPAVGEVYMRTVALCEQSGEKGDPYAEALHGLAQHHLSAARFDDAARVATVLLDHAREAGQPHPEVLAHRALSQVRFWTGRYTELWEHSARAMELYDPEAPVEQRFAMGIESGVIAMTYGAVGLWALGRPHEAAAMADRCVEHAKRQPDVYQQAYAQAYLSMLGIMLIDPERVERWALAAKSIAERHGFAPLEGLSRYTLAWAMAERGHPESFDMVVSGIGILAALGTGIGAPGCMAVVAEMYAKDGQFGEAAGYVAFGEAMADGTGQHFYTVELHRSAALAHLGLADAADDDEVRATELHAAEQRASAAIDLARAQSAASLELRAIQPMIELLCRRGDTEAARSLLADAVAKFPAESSGTELDRARAALRGAAELRPRLRFHEV
ncbi:MAG TPA: adenylate/guanylate cyclase domain-containing protein [Ilumatobacteraceae bacterium]|nr:adenylate/guanylate cyclase domain-containing protein [Ilumatobacteraceae bacterium]